MKKTYMTPTFEVVKINAQRLLAGSETVPVEPTSVSPESSDSRSFSFGDDE